MATQYPYIVKSTTREPNVAVLHVNNSTMFPIDIHRCGDFRSLLSSEIINFDKEKVTLSAEVWLRGLHVVFVHKKPKLVIHFSHRRLQAPVEFHLGKRDLQRLYNELIAVGVNDVMGLATS